MRFSSLHLVAGLCAATLLPAQSAQVTALRADREIIGDGTQCTNAFMLSGSATPSLPSDLASVVATLLPLVLSFRALSVRSDLSW
ncbi:MAG: hypothetical protein ACKOCN_07910, partial [Planctomycetaceae bacterium]